MDVSIMKRSTPRYLVAKTDTLDKMLLLLIASKEEDSGKPVTNLKYNTFELQKHVNSDRH